MKVSVEISSNFVTKTRCSSFKQTQATGGRGPRRVKAVETCVCEREGEEERRVLNERVFCSRSASLFTIRKSGLRHWTRRRRGFFFFFIQPAPSLPLILGPHILRVPEAAHWSRGRNIFSLCPGLWPFALPHSPCEGGWHCSTFSRSLPRWLIAHSGKRKRGRRTVSFNQF